MVADIANHQVQDGHQVSLIYALRADTPANWRELLDARIRCHFLSMVRAIHPIQDIRSGWQLFALFKKLQPDVVHLHSSKAGAIGRIVSLFYRRAQYFFSPHGLSFLQHTSQGKHRIFLYVEKILALFSVPFIACSASEANVICRHLTQHVFIVENAVDPSGIAVKTALNPRLQIGTVGRICPQKNPEMLAAIATACQHLPLDFIWIGSGDTRGEALLQAAGVKVTGWMPRAAVLHALSQWDVYVQTSRWEGMPVAVIEAMLAGLPTIVSNVIGNRDVVVPGKTGFIANDQQEFVQKLITLTQAPETILLLGQAAREMALSRFCISHMIRTLYQVYGLSI
jgi:glycosyltransferase involved in cell wall biosynthesis